MGEKGLLRLMRKDWGADEELEGLSDKSLLSLFSASPNADRGVLLPEYIT